MSAEGVKNSLSDLVQRVEVLLSKHKSFQKNDRLDRLITYFMFKQLDHAHSVLKLDPSTDVALISRTMIDGVINLSWIMEEPDKRAKDWFDFSVMSDFTLLERKEKNGSTISTSDREEIKKNYDDYKLSKKGGPHPNFRCGKSLKNIADSDDKLKGYYESYGYMSDWAHWGVQSLTNAFREDGSGLSYHVDSHPYRVPALMCAFASLLDIAVITNEHFKLEQESSLEEAFSDLMKLP